MNRMCKIGVLLSTVVSAPVVWADHASLGFGIGTASPIVTDSAITLPQGRWAASIRINYVSNSEFSNARIRQLANADAGDFHSTASLFIPALSAAYGVSDNFTLGAQIPWVLRSSVREPSEDNPDSVIAAGQAGGLGDVRVFGQYRFYHARDNAEHAAAIVGLQLPTGDTRVRTRDGEFFEVDNQPGTGAWSPLFGLAYTRNFGRIAFDTSVLYTVSTTGARQYQFGDVFDYNFALSYAVSAPTRTGLAASSNDYPWNLILEFNGEWRGQDRDAGVTNPNTGSHILYISPGIRYAGGKSWNVATTFGAPIVRDVDGVQVRPEYRVVSRISFTF